MKILTEEFFRNLDFEPSDCGGYCKTIGDISVCCYKNAGGYWSAKVTPIKPIQYDRILKVEELKQFIEYTCKSEEESAKVIEAMKEFLK